MKLCECGCGKEVSKPGNRFIYGHNLRDQEVSDEHKKKISAALTGIKRSDETKKKMSETKLGHTVSDETKKKMSEAKLGIIPWMKGKLHSDETKLKISESKKGQVPWNKGISPSYETRKKISDGAFKFYDDMDDPGQQIVGHHYIYDESDLSKYTMKVTRAKHAQIHAWMRKAGIVVPHINIKEVL